MKRCHCPLRDNPKFALSRPVGKGVQQVHLHSQAWWKAAHFEEKIVVPVP